MKRLCTFFGITVLGQRVSITFLPRLVLGAASIALMLCGCGGNGTGAVAPEAGQPLLAHLSDAWEAGETATVTHQLWGYYVVSVNDDHSEFSILPLRVTETHWNIINYLETKPCTDCFKIVPPVTPSGNGTLLVNISIKHPFPKAKFTGFDVRGIAMFNGTSEFPTAGVVTSDRYKGEGALVNADGFTTLYNPTTLGSGPGGLQGYIHGKLATKAVPSSTLNGYKRFVSSAPGNTRNAFYSGDTVIATYEIDMPSGPFVFGYAIDASWAPPTKEPVTDPIADFPPSANCPEPWKIEIEEDPIGGGITECGGETRLEVKVYDYGGVDIDTLAAVECPALFDELMGLYYISDEDGYTLFETWLYNDKLAPAGKYQCLVWVEDPANESAPEWLDLSAYHIAEIEVIPFSDSPPTAVAWASKTSANAYEILDFSATGSFDGDCGGESIVKAEWDWNNDGIYDEVGMNLKHWFGSAGVHKVKLRVTDDEGNTDAVDTPYEISITDTFEVVFPDPKLNKKIRSLIGVPEPNPIMFGNLVSLDTLSAPLGGIKDLTGLNYCYNLREVNLEWCQINNIAPMLTLVKMEYLKLNNNANISDISPLRYMKEVTYLDLSGNWFEDISALAGMTKMVNLNLNGNGKISDISPLAGMSQLDTLGLDENSISDLSPLTGKASLTSLDVGDNNISDITPLGSCINLKVLDISDNNISNIGALTSVGGLLELYAQYNNIIDISPVGVMYDLRIINLAGNPVPSDMLHVFADKQNYGHIRLSSTNVSDIQPLVDNPYLSDNGGGPGVEPDTIWLEDCPLSDYCIEYQIPALFMKGVVVYF